VVVQEGVARGLDRGRRRDGGEHGVVVQDGELWHGRAGYTGRGPIHFDKPDR
jgi:hypothetical protein